VESNDGDLEFVLSSTEKKFDEQILEKFRSILLESSGTFCGGKVQGSLQRK